MFFSQTSHITGASDLSRSGELKLSSNTRKKPKTIVEDDDESDDGRLALLVSSESESEAAVPTRQPKRSPIDLDSDEEDPGFSLDRLTEELSSHARSASSPDSNSDWKRRGKIGEKPLPDSPGSSGSLDSLFKNNLFDSDAEDLPPPVRSNSDSSSDLDIPVRPVPKVPTIPTADLGMASDSELSDLSDTPYFRNKPMSKQQARKKPVRYTKPTPPAKPASKRPTPKKPSPGDKPKKRQAKPVAEPEPVLSSEEASDASDSDASLSDFFNPANRRKAAAEKKKAERQARLDKKATGTTKEKKGNKKKNKPAVRPKPQRRTPSQIVGSISSGSESDEPKLPPKTAGRQASLSPAAELSGPGSDDSLSSLSDTILGARSKRKNEKKGVKATVSKKKEEDKKKTRKTETDKTALPILDTKPGRKTQKRKKKEPTEPKRDPILDRILAITSQEPQSVTKPKTKPRPGITPEKPKASRKALRNPDATLKRPADFGSIDLSSSDESIPGMAGTNIPQKHGRKTEPTSPLPITGGFAALVSPGNPSAPRSTNFFAFASPDHRSLSPAVSPIFGRPSPSPPLSPRFPGSPMVLSPASQGSSPQPHLGDDETLSPLREVDFSNAEASVAPGNEHIMRQHNDDDEEFNIDRFNEVVDAVFDNNGQDRFNNASYLTSPPLSPQDGLPDVMVGGVICYSL